MDAVEWKFERREGLPKGDGARAYRYFGFDADNAAYVLRWSDRDGGAWIAVGFDTAGAPIAHLLRDDNANLIVAHALAPLRRSELGLAPERTP